MGLLGNLAAIKYLLSNNNSGKTTEVLNSSTLKTKYSIGNREVSKKEFDAELGKKSIAEYNADIKYSTEKYGDIKTYYDIFKYVNDKGLFDTEVFEKLKKIYCDERYVNTIDTERMSDLLLDSYTDYEYKTNTIVKEWHENKKPYFLLFNDMESTERKMKNRFKYYGIEFSKKWYYDYSDNIIAGYLYEGKNSEKTKDEILSRINELCE